MSALVEAQSLLRKVAEPVPAGDSVKAAICRASRRLRWNFNRTKSLWYGDQRAKVSGDELNQLRDVAKQSAGGGDDLLARTAIALETVAARLDRIDPDMFGTDCAALRDLANRMRV